ncbi:MAG: undecaprenyldiphospho-muramoylpentapeptide beta-N-acetylglucosaminyltransferase [Candidatus Brocadiia bacterium]
MRILLAGGGTGGHLFPGLALVEELRRRDPAHRFWLLCTRRDRAYGALQEEGLQRVALPALSSGPLVRRAAVLVPAVWAALRHLRRVRPHVVVGLGGYASAAPVVCAALLRLPRLLLEQNVVPGKTNRWLSRLATEVACQWAESAPFFPRRGKVRVTGNPVRSRIQREDRAGAARALGLDPALPTLLVMGGSQGARPLNELMMAALPHFERGGRGLQFVHLAGRADRERVAAAYEQHGMPAAVVGFLEDMGRAYSACDLALSRAGGTSIAELTALGVPALLVPYPLAAERHQHFNARVLEYRGAAELLEQGTLSPRRLARRVAVLLSSPARLAYMGKQSRRFGVPRAASVVADRVETLAAAQHRRSVGLARDAAASSA